jgi:hypothetical protein
MIKESEVLESYTNPTSPYSTYFTSGTVGRAMFTQSYLDILGEEIIGKYVKCSEVSDLIELENHLYKVVWEGIIPPGHPAITCNQ